MSTETDEVRISRAFELAAKSFAEGGCPIGAVLVDNSTGRIIGEGHNALVQEGNPVIGAEGPIRAFDL